jgi:hypothetical protein
MAHACAAPRPQLSHAAAGVEKGLKSANSMPIEVMGLMQGHVDTEEAGTLIVTDVRAAVAWGAVLRGICRVAASLPQCASSAASHSHPLPLQVFPLPVEGTETSVMTENVEVSNYMIELSNQLESVRRRCSHTRRAAQPSSAGEGSAFASHVCCALPSPPTGSPAATTNRIRRSAPSS